MQQPSCHSSINTSLVNRASVRQDRRVPKDCRAIARDGHCRASYLDNQENWDKWDNSGSWDNPARKEL